MFHQVSFLAQNALLSFKNVIAMNFDFSFLTKAFVFQRFNIDLHLIKFKTLKLKYLALISF